MDEMTERNRRVVEDRESGMTYRQIAERYGFSIERGRKIVVGAEQQKHRSADRDRQQQDRDRWDRQNPIIKSLPKRIRNGLLLAGIRDDTSLLMASDIQLGSIRNFGEKTVAEINEKRRGAE